MDTGNLNQELYNKMSAEQDKFRTRLMDQPPADILNHAVEYAVREDILMEMETLELPVDQVRALLVSPDTMADIYKTFSKMADTGHMDVVRESIEDRADALIQSGALSQPAPERQEAVYLVDRAFLLHMKEVQGGDFEYAVFDRQTKEKTAGDKISGDDVMDGIDPTHNYLAAARDAALEGAGLDGIEVAQVGLTALKDFPRSDIHRRSIWEPDTLPKGDLRFINSGYDEQFRKLFDEKFNVTKSGELEVVGCSINEVQDMILTENKLGSRSMMPTDYGLLMAKAAQKEMDVTQNQPEQTDKKPSIKKQLAAKPVPGDKPITKPKDREVR